MSHSDENIKSGPSDSSVSNEEFEIQFLKKVMARKSELDRESFKNFVESKDVSTERLSQICKAVVDEDLRLIPVIICAFGDTLLKEAFDEILPRSLPGGKRNVLGGFGPLSDLSKRISLAYAFGVFSRHVMVELDKVRHARNKISHDWNHSALSGFHNSGKLADLVSIEEFLLAHADRFPEFGLPLDDATAFRVRMIWLAWSMFYERYTYYEAVKRNLNVLEALYSDPSPDLVRKSGKIARDESLAVIRKANAGKS